MDCYVRRTHVPATAEAVFRWYTRPGAFEALCPPWVNMSVLKNEGVRDASKVALQLALGPLRAKWILEHRDFIEGVQFRDRQLTGPFRAWEHTHKFKADASGCTLEDEIVYELPAELPLAKQLVEHDLERLFRYREEVLNRVFNQPQETTMNIAVTGSHGLIGQMLCPMLTTAGHTVRRLVRGATGGDTDVRWDPGAGVLDDKALDGVDAVIHLGGENIAAGRWTPERKRQILESRVKSTKLLSEKLAGMSRPPKVFICASAVGFYGDTGDAVADESTANGTGFLAEVCREWENATAAARAAGIRVINLRIGMVLSPKGGALGKMLLPFQMGAGGIIGNGKQYMSWVAIDDVVGIIRYALTHEDLSGPVNAVAPTAVTNQQFTRALGHVLHRPTICPVPDFGVKLLFGEMGNELLLGSNRVKPERLLTSGYQYQYPDLEQALRHVLGQK